MPRQRFFFNDYVTRDRFTNLQPYDLMHSFRTSVLTTIQLAQVSWDGLFLKNRMLISFVFENIDSLKKWSFHHFADKVSSLFGALVKGITVNQRKCKSCRREEVRQRRLWDLAIVSSFQGRTRKLRIDLLGQGLSNAHAEIRCTEPYDLWVKRYRWWQRDSSPVRLTSNLFTLNSINCVERVVSRLSDGWCFRSC